ncbi:hypothetical protein HWV62_2850 [Athelia sp. TMB]|nr:hypothetical protein HWV62_2850 [Athelia sp. TMB]
MADDGMKTKEAIGPCRAAELNVTVPGPALPAHIHERPHQLILKAAFRLAAGRHSEHLVLAPLAPHPRRLLEDGDAREHDPPPQAFEGASPAPPKLVLPSSSRASSCYSPSTSAANSRQSRPLAQWRPLDTEQIIGRNKNTLTLEDPLRAQDDVTGGHGLTPTSSHMSAAGLVPQAVDQVVYAPLTLPKSRTIGWEEHEY